MGRQYFAKGDGAAPAVEAMMLLLLAYFLSTAQLAEPLLPRQSAGRFPGSSSRCLG